MGGVSTRDNPRLVLRRVSSFLNGIVMSEDFTPKTPISPIHAYWDRPNPRDYGEQDVIQLFQAVGEALGTWENIEHAFAQVFGIFVESHSQAALRAYGVIASHSGRREALETAAEVYFATRKQLKTARESFDLLVEHLARASSRRNEIAHSTPMHFIVDEKARGFFSVPAAYNSRKTTPFITDWENIAKRTKADSFAVFGLDYRYTAEDIRQFIQRFQLLQKQTLELLVFFIQKGVQERTGRPSV